MNRKMDAEKSVTASMSNDFKDDNQMLMEKYQKLKDENKRLKEEKNDNKEGSRQIEFQLDTFKDRIVKEIRKEIIEGLADIVKDCVSGIREEIVYDVKKQMKDMIIEANKYTIKEVTSLVVAELKPILLEAKKNEACDLGEMIKENIQDAKKEMKEMIIESKNEITQEMNQKMYEELKEIKQTIGKVNENPFENAENRNNDIENLRSQITVIKKQQEDIVTCTNSDNLKQEVISIIKDQDNNKRRRKNIIMYRIPESDKDDRNQREEDDKINAMKVLNEGINIRNVKPNRIFRLGKRNFDRNIGLTNTRPLMMNLENEEDKWEILKSAKKLKNANGWMRKVGISPDLNKDERKGNAEHRAGLKS